VPDFDFKRINHVSDSIHQSSNRFSEALLPIIVNSFLQSNCFSEAEDKLAEIENLERICYADANMLVLDSEIPNFIVDWCSFGIIRVFFQA